MKRSIFTLLLSTTFLSHPIKIAAYPHPIGFSIPESKIVTEIPEKDFDFAIVIPGDLYTYVFYNEEDYYEDYQRSYYGVTCKKGGWDCLRHYEILANGCIPYFTDIDECDDDTMHLFPKYLIKKAMELEGVFYLSIDYQKFDVEKYNALLNELLEHMRTHLTCKKMAEYILETIDYKGSGKILYLGNSQYPDYLRCLTLIGFKELAPLRIVDVPKIEHLYANYEGNIEDMYGRGMTYTKVLPDEEIDRENIEERIAAHAFDLIIYSSVHRGTPYYDLVYKHYKPEEIVYLCGEDIHSCEYTHLHNFFLREFEGSVDNWTRMFHYITE